MTTPALLVLSLALGCSIFGTASEQIADHDSKLPMQSTQPKSNLIYDEIIIDNIPMNMKTTRTNVYNYVTDKKYLTYEDRSNKYKARHNNKIDKYNEVFTEYKNDRHTGLNEYNINLNVKNNKRIADEIPTKYEEHKLTKENKYSMDINSKRKLRQYNNNDKVIGKRVKRDLDPEVKCENFKLSVKDNWITHPHDNNEKNYYNNTDCVTVLKADVKQVIKLTFVDMFHIEETEGCAYDFLEIRDGSKGYARLLGKLCGETFPPQIISSGPYLWLKFHSDDTIEYEGFHINVEYKTTESSHIIPEACNKILKGMYGNIDSADLDPECLAGSVNQALDVVWTIQTPGNTKIFLNFTSYALVKPNECEENVLQVYGYILEFDSILENYCGSMANPVTTKGDAKGHQGNIMYIRMYASITARKSAFKATYTAFRTVDPTKNEKCDPNTEFNCQDNTCIDLALKCDHTANCRLKTDEDVDTCKGEDESIIKEPHILIILVIFSLIISGMSFVFLFKCIKKLYQDHKIIKEHIQRSCEDRLDTLVAGDSRFTLDPKKLQRDSEPRASLERENHTNEMFKQQRKHSHRKPSSIDSDFIQETHLDLDEEPWRREVDSVPIQAQDIKIERNGRTRRSDTSKREESLKSKIKEIEEKKEKKEIRDASVAAPDTKESGCQTRESLFQAEKAPSSEGSGTNSRGFSTFGYSGATIARPSPPAPTNTSEITIELLSQVTPHQESEKPQKKIPDRRPMSSETTRSAPDVIIVSKPIR